MKGAQIVLFGIGGADLNDGDDAFEAGQCRMERCYAPVLAAFARNFDATVAEVRKLRASEETVLRATTMPNALTGAEDVIPPFLRPVSTRLGTYMAKTANRAICGTMTKYDGQRSRRPARVQRPRRGEERLRHRAAQPRGLLLRQRQGPAAHGRAAPRHRAGARALIRLAPPGAPHERSPDRERVADQPS